MEPSENSNASVTELLAHLNDGDPEVRSRLINLVYGELRRRAAMYMAQERGNHTLQPTALVHEAYLRLIQQEVSWQSRAHFFALAAQIMRNLLVDSARAQRAKKRGGARQQITLDDAMAFEEARSVDVIALDAALKKLATFDPRQSRIVELRFFGGLTLDEAAEVLHVAPRTAKRDWRMARSWLQDQLKPGRNGTHRCDSNGE